MSEKLQKFISSAGVCSRRECEILIAQGKIKVNGKPAEIGQRIDPEKDKVVYQSRQIKPTKNHVYYALNKPRGYITSLSPKQGRSIKSLINGIPQKVYPVGRLDKDSEGLILLTNDGSWANELTHPRFEHEKEYIVTVNKPIPEHTLKSFKKGLLLNKRRLRSVKYHSLSSNRRQVHLILKQGINRQIRRMFEKYGITVVRLKRIRVAEYKLGNIKLGEYKKISP